MSVLVWSGALVAGGSGAVARFLVDRTVGQRFGRAFPFGTLAVNLSGAVILGLLSGMALSRDVALIAGTAAIGSYTTFSTWMLETHRLSEERQLLTAAANVAVSVVAGVCAAALGQAIGARL